MKTIDEIQKTVKKVLDGMTAEQVAGAFLDYHGWQLIDAGFAKNLVDEGYCDEADVGIEEDEDEEGKENE